MSDNVLAGWIPDIGKNPGVHCSKIPFSQNDVICILFF
ncbi:hypothetical Protein YC6258_04836 [Gynuella sunshinyii YC6258]|uniref:Uncharacterized protein n=1 Tax=Gynuella sunshinyii YC6258 TaxID=1445510 RepID=A0A0C5VU83_9GAMM|nr:hypothetical Protein YC6258_04836 [Gynuella sunshinyii YC6258]